MRVRLLEPLLEPLLELLLELLLDPLVGLQLDLRPGHRLGGLLRPCLQQTGSVPGPA